MRLTGSGIEVNELAAIDIGQVFSVGGPGEPIGRISDERSSRENLFDRERLFRRDGFLLVLTGYGKSCK